MSASTIRCLGVWAMMATLVLVSPRYASATDGPDLKDYLKKRTAFRCAVGADVDALETTIGSRILEIRGKVSGRFSTGQRSTLLLQTESEPVGVDTFDPIPQWLENGQWVRLIVRAKREVESDPLVVTLLGMHPDSEITQIEEAETRAAQMKARALMNARTLPSKPVKTPTFQWNLPYHEATPYYAQYIMGVNKRLSRDEAYGIAEGIIGFSRKFGVDARLVMAMILAESSFNVTATSHSGAQGLGQLMPGTAAGLGITNAYDTTQNLYGTVRLIRGHLEKYSKSSRDGYEALVLALAAYNAGSGNVRKHQGVPPFKQTQDYIRKVVATYKRLAGIQ